MDIAIHFGRQAKHLLGRPEYEPGKSVITLTLPQIQDLIDEYAGTGEWHGGNKEIIDFGIIIGLYQPDEGGTPLPTTRGTIHYSKAGTHLVPSKPNPTK